jgi:hypothetical protein
MVMNLDYNKIRNGTFFRRRLVMVCKFRLLLLMAVIGLMFSPIAANAAEVTNIFTLNMDGALDGTTYSGDTGNPTVAVTAGLDESGNAPVFSDGTVYFCGAGSSDPDYSSWPTTSDNTNGRIYAWAWFKTVWDDVNSIGNLTKSIYYRIGPDSTGIDPNYQVANAGGVVTQYGTTSPSTALSSSKFSHVAIVWTWNSTTNMGNMKYYVNGTKLVDKDGTSGYQPLNYLPELFGIGNMMYSGINEGDDASTYNFNAGFSGWIDSIALSTFTGTFAGPWECQLVNPQYCGDVGTEYKTSDLNKDCKVNFADLAELAADWMYDGISTF